MKKNIPFFILYFFLSLINIRAKLVVTSVWFNGVLERNHNLLLGFDYTNNEQSRLFQFYIPEAFVALFNLSIPHAYILQRFGFVFLAFCCFHVYLKKWFDNKGVVLGVVLLAAVMPLTYLPHLQESAPLLMLSFLLGLWAIRENRPWHFMAVLFLGALNNETILILPAVYVFYKFSTYEGMLETTATKYRFVSSRFCGYRNHPIHHAPQRTSERGMASVGQPHQHSDIAVASFAGLLE